MTGPRAGTWLGDAVAVIRDLGLTADEDIRKIAPMLGLEYTGGQQAGPAPEAAGPVHGTAAELPVPVPPPVSGPGVSRLRALAELALPPLEPVDAPPPRELTLGPDVMALPEEGDGTPPELPFRPLLRPGTAAGVAAALVRTWEPGSRIDERRAVDRLARGRPVREFPRRPRPSLRRGVQVLTDLGDAMDPYGRDQQSVVKLIQRVAGPRMTATGSFENCPSRGVWLLPRGAAVRGRPVLVLTDLGLGGPPVQPARASAAEWIRYARRAARAGSPVIALIPYPLGRVRGAARRRMAVVPWDRASVSAVQRARRQVT